MPPARRPSTRSPSPPRAPRLPPLRLAPLRSDGSVELDQSRTKSGLLLPPFVRWDKFIAEWEWRAGEHVTLIAPTGAGKTVLARNLLKRAPVLPGNDGAFVVVLGIKNRDRELYPAFQRDGYELVRKFDPVPDEDVRSAHVLFAPLSEKDDATAERREKSRKFAAALNGVRRAGGWVAMADDIAYMSDQLQLRSEFEELWIIGRSEDVSVVALSQEPVNIPVMAYGMATHLFLFKNPDLVRAKRMAELTGMNREIAEHTILRLPDHEFLYINKSSGRMLRSKVIPA